MKNLIQVEIRIQNFIFFLYCIFISTTSDYVNGKSSGGSRGSGGSGSSGESGGSVSSPSPSSSRGSGSYGRPGGSWGSGSPGGSWGSGSPGGSGGYGYHYRYYPYTPSYYYYYYYHNHGSGSRSDDDTFADPALPPANQTDKDDAAAIVNGNLDEKVIASILPFRTLEHRKIINNEIANIHKGEPLIPKKYLPTHSNNSPFKDLCFSLVNYPITILAMYLGEYLHHRDETYIIIVLTLCQQMQQLTYIYNRNHKNSLKKRRKKQRHPFSNLMRVWVERDRDPEDSTFTDTDINNDAESLKNEYPNWNDDRDALESILIRKSLKFSLGVIQKFEADLNIIIEDAIKDKIKNHDLVDAYISLALFVKNRYNYMAKTLLERCDGTYSWAVWIMYVGFIDPNDWPLIDTEFKLINNNVSLKDHILSNPESDKILLQVMAVMIDPTYKPPYL